MKSPPASTLPASRLLAAATLRGPLAQRLKCQRGALWSCELMDIPCQRCRKRKANVHVTEVLPAGDKKELHLCDDCAGEMGIVQKTQKSLDDILTEFIQVKGSPAEPVADGCDACGLTWAQFKQTGLLGCAKDYELFSERLAPLLERAHAGGTRHVGKTPRRVDGGPKPAARLAQLRRELEEAVKGEDYELAARLRDRMQELEKRLAPQADERA